MASHDILMEILDLESSNEPPSIQLCLRNTFLNASESKVTGWVELTAVSFCTVHPETDSLSKSDAKHADGSTRTQWWDKTRHEERYVHTSIFARTRKEDQSELHSPNPLGTVSCQSACLDSTMQGQVLPLCPHLTKDRFDGTVWPDERTCVPPHPAGMGVGSSRGSTAKHHALCGWHTDVKALVVR